MARDSGVGPITGPATFVAPPTGVVAADKPALQNAVANTPANGLIVLGNGGSTPYAIDVPLVINKNLRMEGSVCSPVSFNFGEAPLVSPFLTGSVILQKTAATDGIQITNPNAQVSLRNFGIRFDNPGTVAFANTGHGINANPGAGNVGLSNSTWEDVWVFGTDGNHYGYNLVAPLLCQFLGLRSIGGGVVFIVDQAGVTCGNLVFFHPFGSICCSGTAHGYGISAGAAGVGLITFIRPQVNANDFHTSAAYGNPAAPVAAQYLYNDLVGTGIAAFINVYDADMELGGAITLPHIGTGTYWWGHANAPDDLFRVAFGQQAVATAQGTAVGHAANASGLSSTAVGNGASTGVNDVATALGGLTSATGKGSVAIGVDHTFTGASATVQDAFVLGTGNHRYQLPGKVASDEVFDATGHGPVLVDSANGHTYRLTTTNGALVLVQVT